jgi:hypothetical protein
VQSADLQRRYAAEYSFLLRVIPDREVAKEAARVNVSALILGQPRIVSLEGRFNVNRLKQAIPRGEADLDAIRRAVARVIELALPEISRVRLPLVDSGRER